MLYSSISECEQVVKYQNTDNLPFACDTVTIHPINPGLPFEESSGTYYTGTVYNENYWLITKAQSQLIAQLVNAVLIFCFCVVIIVITTKLIISIFRK